jgi:hypothetical protein
MKVRWKSIVSRTLVVLFVAVFACISAAASGDHEDDFVYNRMGTISGTVTIVNHPTLGRTPAANRETIIFQRTDCRKCLVAAQTDEDGHYEVRVAQGRYKVIVRYGAREGELQDGLSPDQPRYVEVRSAIECARFDIALRLP